MITFVFYTVFVLIHFCLCSARLQRCQLSWFIVLGLMASSHREHGQDKTVLSCLVGGVNWVRGSRREFSIYWRQNSFVSSAVWTHLRTRQDSFHTAFRDWTKLFRNFSVADSLDLSPIQFTPRTRTRQDSLVLSVFAVWTSHKCVPVMYSDTTGCDGCLLVIWHNQNECIVSVGRFLPRCIVCNAVFPMSICPSVCLSVCPSVCQTRELWQNEST